MVIRKREVCCVSLPLRWRFGPKLPPPNLPLPYLYLLIICPWESRVPSRSDRPQSLASLAQLASSTPRLPCHSLPSPAARFLDSPGIRGSQSPALPSPPSSVYIDLQISRPIPPLAPGHPSPRLSGEPNRPTAWLPAFPRRQRSPLQISDLVSIKLSRISASCYSPFQLHEFPKTVSAPTPPLLTKPAS
jgi:hypothetical protein